MRSEFIVRVAAKYFKPKSKITIFLCQAQHACWGHLSLLMRSVGTLASMNFIPNAGIKAISHNGSLERCIFVAWSWLRSLPEVLAMPFRFSSFRQSKQRCARSKGGKYEVARWPMALRAPTRATATLNLKVFHRYTQIPLSTIIPPAALSPVGRAYRLMALWLATVPRPASGQLMEYMGFSWLGSWDLLNSLFSFTGPFTSILGFLMSYELL